jgi:hypothetical protein
LGHLLPVVVRKTRQLDTQKPPVRERNVTPAGVPPKAAGRGQAEKGLLGATGLTAHRPQSQAHGRLG